MTATTTTIKRVLFTRKGKGRMMVKVSDERQLSAVLLKLQRDPDVSGIVIKYRP